MVEIIPRHTCSKPGCDVSKTGICVEGNTPAESCPFLGRPVDSIIAELEEDLNEEALEEHSQESDVANISLPRGEKLFPYQVDQFLLKKSVKLITIIGEQNSGKTTLTCALYDSFLRGRYAGHSFGGSTTLVGLEKHSHLSRTESGRIKTDTQRTSHSEGLRFFHFSLVSDDISQLRVDLMLSDRAGEHYEKARSNSDMVSELIEVQKAHYVVLLLDGKRIADPVHRHGAMQAVRQSIQAFLDGGAIIENSRLQVVMTKNDLLQDLSTDQDFKKQLEHFYNGLKRDFADRLDELSFWSIAARDPKGFFPVAYGMDLLVKSWCRSELVKTKHGPIHVLPQTEFDLLLSRTRMENIP